MVIYKPKAQKFDALWQDNVILFFQEVESKQC